MLFILWNVLGGILFILCLWFSFRLMRGYKYEQEETEPIQEDIA